MLFHIVGISYKHPTNPFLLTQSESDVKDYNVVSVSVLRWTPTGSNELAGDIDLSTLIAPHPDWLLRHHSGQSLFNSYDQFVRRAE
jgi:hypothetical protein